ncbi:MAG TPA: serine/threonine-protein kinase, partial [Allocoleopsis sp.]
PGCFNPQNPDDNQFCHTCGSKLLLNQRYRAIKPLSQGGFGKTFLAVDLHIPSFPKCVIKQLFFNNYDPVTYRKVVSLFRQEAIRLDELGKHPQIPELLAYFEQNKYLYLLQEFIEGKTLHEDLQETGIYDEQKIKALLLDMLPVLQFVHEKNVIHRDIKPPNIMRRKSDNHLILIDFGISKQISETNLLQTGTIVGTVDYMSPEQARGKVFPGSDIYSLGVSCIYLLTGEKPGNMFDVVEEKWNWRDYLRGYTVSNSLGKILDKMIESSVKNRYQNAGEILADIQKINQQTQVIMQPRQMLASGNQLYAKTEIMGQKQPAKIEDLIDQVKIDYYKLQELLRLHKWKEGDQETWHLLCQSLGKETGRYIFISDLRKIPLPDLLMIDLLWQKYTDNRFGFRVQKEIFESVGKEYNLFCQKVGWPLHQPYIPDKELQFTKKAPRGHLPSRKWVGGTNWWEHLETMSSRFDENF